MMPIDHQQDLKEVKDLLTELRICVAKIQTTLDERTKINVSIDERIRRIDADLDRINQRIAYAAGAAAAGALVLNIALKKLGIA